VRLAAGSWIELEDGQLEVVGPGPAGGLYTSYVVRDAGLLAAAVLPDGSDLQEARRNDRGSGGRVIAKTSAPADA
jgi:hypothetical protein